MKKDRGILVKVKFLDDYYIIALQTVFHHHHPSKKKESEKLFISILISNATFEIQFAHIQILQFPFISLGV